MAEASRVTPAAYRSRTGITLEQYEALLAAQGGGCAICGSTPKTRKLHADHDHKTGELRGLLCFRCNHILRPYVTLTWLRSAVRYLERAESGSDVRRALARGDRDAGTLPGVRP